MNSMMWLGYLTMCKCCLYSTAVCVGIPLFCYLRRRYEQPNWEAANNNVLSRLAVQKFGGLVNRNEDDTKSCVICYDDFTEQDDVTTLPCNAKHIFHKDCIKKWLENKNTCPLCNVEISEELI